MPGEQVREAYRAHSGELFGFACRSLGNRDLAEEAVQEAFVAAAERWPATGLPPNPGAWITTTARNKAIDRLRRERSRHTRQTEATRMLGHDDEPREPARPPGRLPEGLPEGDAGRDVDPVRRGRGLGCDIGTRSYGVTAPVPPRRPANRAEKCLDAPRRGRRVLRNPAASYSPRGSPPKYHRRWQS